MSAAPFHRCSSLCRAILILENLIWICLVVTHPGDLRSRARVLSRMPSRSNAPLALLAWGSVPAGLGSVSVRRSNPLMHKHLCTSLPHSMRAGVVLHFTEFYWIGHFHEDDIWLQLSEFISFFLSYSNLPIPLRLTATWRILVVVVKWSH